MSHVEKIFNHKWFRNAVIVIVTLCILSSFYFYMQVRSLKQNSQVQAEQEVSDLVEKVGKLAVLPIGEVPTVATVSNPEALRSQSFFADAQKGDKVLIYIQSQKAILYSVSLNKVVEMAPLSNIDTQKK